MKSCKECKFAILQDTGYSNYTVMGTDFFCGKSMHPEDGFDYWYGEDKKLEFANECVGFEKGDPIQLDCDGEYEPTPEEKVILDAWNNLSKGDK